MRPQTTNPNEVSIGFALKAKAAEIRHSYRLAAQEYRQWISRIRGAKAVGAGIEPAPGSVSDKS